MGEVICLKLSVKRGILDFTDCRESILEIAKVCSEFWSIK